MPICWNVSDLLPRSDGFQDDRVTGLDRRTHCSRRSMYGQAMGDIRIKDLIHNQNIFRRIEHIATWHIYDLMFRITRLETKKR